MSGGGGARALRGSPGGAAQGFTVTGCAYLSSILHVPLKPQDRSRITALRLGDLAGDAGQADAVRSGIRAIRELAPALWRRAIKDYDRFQDTFGLYRSAILQSGLDPRPADQIATLLAGRDLLLNDYPPCSDSIEAELERAAPLIRDAQEQAEEGEGQQCLNHLYSSPVDLWRSGERPTVSQLVMDAMDMHGSEKRRMMGTIGLRLIHYRDPARRRLIVANAHVGLNRIFAGTRWENGAWQQALRYLPGAEAAKPNRFAGIFCRGTAIPPDCLPSDDARDEEE
jgi:hypothetical protein